MKPFDLGRRAVLKLITAAPAISLPSFVYASKWPAKPLTFICPFSAGGPTDLLSRIYADRLSKILGQRVIVENRTGAGGTIGMSYLAKSAADGYTLGLMSNATHVFVKAVLNPMPYDAEKDFSQIAGLWELPNVLIINPKVPARNVSELIELCKNNPGKLSYASAGIGTTTHLAAEFFARQAGLKINHIPYRGASQAIVDLIAGTVDMFFMNIPGVAEYVKSGKVVPLAVTSLRRSPSLPDLPAMSEFLNGFEMTSWTAVAGPAKIPEDVKEILERSTRVALADPVVSEKISGLGAAPYIADGRVVEARRAKQESEVLPSVMKMGLTK